MKGLKSVIRIRLKDNKDLIEVTWDGKNKFSFDYEKPILVDNIQYINAGSEDRDTDVCINIQSILDSGVMLYDLRGTPVDGESSIADVFLAKVLDLLQYLGVELTLYVTVGDRIYKHLEKVGFKPLPVVVNPRTNNELKTYSLNLTKFNYNEFINNYDNNAVPAAGSVQA